MLGFLLRWLFALVLVAGTWNPTGWNYVAWLSRGAEPRSLAALAGLGLLIGYVIYLRATLRSIGVFGMALVAAVVAAVVWVGLDYGLISLSNPTVTAWLGIFGLSLVLGVGMNWSRVRRALTGQLDVDEVDE